MSTRVLLLEDNLDLQEELRDNLQAICCTVHTSEDAAGAIELAGRNHYDLMVTDIRLAGNKDGISALEAIRKTPRHGDLPCIVITGFSENEVVLRALEVHIQAYLTKPFGLGALYNSVQTCLKAQTGKTEVQSAVQTLMRWFRLDPKSQEEKREREKAPLLEQIESARRNIYSIFCSGLQMNTDNEGRAQERFLLISMATDIWHELRGPEKSFFKFHSLPVDESRALVGEYQKILARLKDAIAKSRSGTGIYPKDQNLSKDVFVRFVRRIEARQITPEETAMGWLLWELREDARSKDSRLQEMHQLLWGQDAPEQRRWKDPKEILQEARRLNPDFEE